MSARPRRLVPPPVEKRIGGTSQPPWIMPLIVTVAVLVVAAALVVTIATGTLFTSVRGS